MFGCGDRTDPKVNEYHRYRLNDLCVNGTVGSNTASLQTVALAAAARVYAQLIDHPVGGATGVMNTSVIPAGCIKSVTHELSPQGEMATHLVIPDKMPQISIFRYLDAGTRAVVLRLVQQDTAQ
jgi:hypothetical protein